MVESTSAESSPSLLSGMLRQLTHACARRPRVTLALVALATAGCIVLTATCLKFKTDRSDLIDPSTPFHQRWLRYTESFGESSDMVVIVEAQQPETIKHALDTLGGKLKNEPDLFANVLYKIEPGQLRSKGLQYLPPDSLAVGLERLEEYRPILHGRWDLVRLESLIPLLRYQLQDLRQSGMSHNGLLWQHAERLSESLARFAEDRNDFVNPWPDIVPIDPNLREQGNQTVYMLNEQGTMGFLMAAPVKADDGFEGATVAIDRLRKLISETTSEIPDARILLTGIPVLENDEMRQSQKDSMEASLLSLGGVALLLLLGFRGFRHPALGIVMLAVAMAWAFGFTTAVIGHLNILSVSFAAILIGLGIDFAIHMLARYLELRHRGRELRHAIVETAGTVGPGIVTGAVTTSLAFFCAMLTEFLGVAELGLIAGGGILLCAVAAFTCLPALIALVDRHTEPRALPIPFEGRLLRRSTQRYPGSVLLASTALLAVIGWLACDWSHGWPRPNVIYDHNLLHLQAEGLESVEAQKRIFEASNNSLLYAISLADSADEAREMKARFEALPTVRHVEELATRLPDHSAQETQLLVQAFHAYLSGLPDQPPPPDPAIPAQVGRMLDEYFQFLQQNPSPVADRIAHNLDRFLQALDRMDIQEQMTVLAEFQYRLAYALLAQFQALAEASDPTPVSVDDLPPALKSRYVSPQGKWLLQVFPRDQVWDMQPLEAFVRDVRTVDPEVTGTPLQNFEAALQIKESYEICAAYALLVILIVLLMAFLKNELVLQTFVPPAAVAVLVAAVLAARQIQVPFLGLVSAYAATAFALACCWHRQAAWDTLLALLPPVGGLVLTLAVLSIWGIPLNPANLIILPLILGIGVDNGVHVVHDFHSRPYEKYSPASSIVNSIFLTSTTTMVGFGSMMLAAHRGLYSLGAVLTIGVASCLFLSLVVLPAILAAMSRDREPPANVDAIAEPPPADDEPAAILKHPSISRVA